MLYGTKWKTKNWISIPIGGGAGPVVYRKSWVKEAGYDRIPDDHEGFLTLCQKLQKIGHPCGIRAWPRAGRRQRVRQLAAVVAQRHAGG